jgi:hypothetical protein
MPHDGAPQTRSLGCHRRRAPSSSGRSERAGAGRHHGRGVLLDQTVQAELGPLGCRAAGRVQGRDRRPRYRLVGGHLLRRQPVLHMTALTVLGLVAPGAAGATQPTARRTAPHIAADLHTLLERAHGPGRMCWPVIRSAASTSKASLRNSQMRSPAWCSWTPPHPNWVRPCQRRPSPTTSSIGSPPYCGRWLTLAGDACSTRSSTAAFRHARGTKHAPTPQPPATSPAGSRSSAKGQGRCSRRPP